MSALEPETLLRYELIHRYFSRSFPFFREHIHCGTVQSSASDSKCGRICKPPLVVNTSTALKQNTQSSGLLHFHSLQ